MQNLGGRRACGAYGVATGDSIKLPLNDARRGCASSSAPLDVVAMRRRCTRRSGAFRPRRRREVSYSWLSGYTIALARRRATRPRWTTATPPAPASADRTDVRSAKRSTDGRRAVRSRPITRSDYAAARRERARATPIVSLSAHSLARVSSLLHYAASSIVASTSASRLAGVHPGAQAHARTTRRSCSRIR